jgi:hypothetical protein
MGHEPSRLVGHAQHSAHLVAANAFLAARQQVGGIDPLMQLDLAALEHGANGHGKWLLALTAFQQAWTCGFALKAMDAVGIGIAAMVSAFNFLTISRGVWAGTNKPCHDDTS